MRKNKMMRTAAVLGVATMLTASVISGTFAKYTTKVDGTDSARVAKWGFTGGSTVALDNLFANAYKSSDGKLGTYSDTTGLSVKSADDKTDIIAPGTEGEATFGFTYAGDNTTDKPEVAYTFNVDASGSTCDEGIKNNNNIVWYLDGKPAAEVKDGETVKCAEGSWDALITAIEALDGNVAANDSTGTPADYYAPNTLPTAFNNYGGNAQNEHKVGWKWNFDDNTSDKDEVTNEQNVKDTALGNKETLDKVVLKITITATQVD